MTRDKAVKAAIRQRMAESGEPYSVARRAVIGARDQEAAGGPEADELRDLAHEAQDLADEAQNLADQAIRRGAWARHEARWAERDRERADRLRGRLDRVWQRTDRLRQTAEHLIRTAEEEWSRARTPDSQTPASRADEDK